MIKALLKQFARVSITILLTWFVGLLAFMLLTKPASANWQSWPSQFMIGLMRTTTAESARAYLGIEVGAPLASTGTGGGMEIGADANQVYVSLGNGQWALVDVASVVNTLLLESGVSLAYETGHYILAE
jgi:hypothetical protein